MSSLDSPKAEKLKKFKNDLHKYHRYDVEYDDRYTFCHLVLMKETRGVKYPIFEVRGWTAHKKEIRLSVVNWTICAGTASLELNEENIDEWRILEDEPALQVLIGYK